ncbi:MAG: hypothetical protein IJD18_02970, partial [Clostridia bacterium]|nr:hypothetical protein [Clostridia bacterium]
MANMQKQSPFCMENAFPKVIAFLLHCAFAILALCVASTITSIENFTGLTKLKVLILADNRIT